MSRELCTYCMGRCLLEVQPEHQGAIEERPCPACRGSGLTSSALPGGSRQGNHQAAMRAAIRALENHLRAKAPKRRGVV